MSRHNILGNRLLEFTNEEFGTNGITKATQGKLRKKNKEKASALTIPLLRFSSVPAGGAVKWLRLQALGRGCGFRSVLCSHFCDLGQVTRLLHASAMPPRRMG